MNDLTNKYRNSLWNTLAFVICIVTIASLSGCAGAGYGRLTTDPEVANAFQNHQVPSDYRYYFYGYLNRPYVIIGVDPKYNAESTLWRKVDPNSEAFKSAIRWVWEDYDFYTYGSYILDPDGNRVGICYTSIRPVIVKFGENNRISVMPHTPFLWGPSVESGEGTRTPG